MVLRPVVNKNAFDISITMRIVEFVTQNVGKLAD